MSFPLVLFQLWLCLRVFSGSLGGTGAVIEVYRIFFCGLPVQVVVDFVDSAFGIDTGSSF